MRDHAAAGQVQFELRTGLGPDGGTAILGRHVEWPWPLPRGFRLAGREGPLTILPQAAGAALLPGDHWRHRLVHEAGQLHLVTAGAGLAHGGGPARVDWQVTVGGGTLAMLPDPWVLSPGADMAQRQEFDHGADAALALIDGFCLRDGPADWRSQTQIRRAGRVILRDCQRADRAQLARIAELPGAMRAFGQVIVVAEPARLAGLGIVPGTQGGDGLWSAAAALRENAGVIVRIAAISGGVLAAALDRWRVLLREAL
ncbi:urease accessory protein UreD [Paracoccus ravus]|uniref:urease accessory protein UreD n=1 Tax=Paracoccus ravus TaxID=2447760 RepID=UPI001FD63B06|nr:urease accessory protein UreD [Paracoccus ravus]